MVLTILKWVAVAMILSLIALWLWEGGYWKIAEYAELIPSPLDASSTNQLYQLPGQPDFFEVPDTTSGENEMEYGSAQDALYDTGAYGGSTERSPYASSIEFQIGAADNPNVSEEYVVIRNSSLAAAPVTVSGWSVRSVYTGMRAVIPMAASPFEQGVVNSVQPITLAAGESVLFSTGASPVGVSFRETMCTGYLEQTQQFSPRLSNACPRPTDLMQRTPQNASRYGASCLDYVERLPQCSYPTIVPSDLSPACRSYLVNTFSYTGCMNAYGSGASTYIGTWRAYAVSSHELWQNTHDSLVLLDAEGRTVATINY
jgi:hypothetical protein